MMSNKFWVFVRNIPVFVFCGVVVAAGLFVCTERGIKAAAPPEWQTLSEERDVYLVGPLGVGVQLLPCIEQDPCDAFCYALNSFLLSLPIASQLPTKSPMRPVAKLLPTAI